MSTRHAVMLLLCIAVAISVAAADEAAPTYTLPEIKPENLLVLCGTVAAIGDNGLLLVETTAGVVAVVRPTPPPADAPAIQVGDKIEIKAALFAAEIKPVEPTQVVFAVSGIMCGACAQAVQKALTATPGVTKVTVDQQNRATVVYDPTATNPELLAKVIVGAKHPHAGMKFGAKLVQ